MVVLALAVMAPRSGSAADRMTLTDANRRWHGAWCRSREPIFLSGNVDRNGVIRSRWIAWKRPGVTNPNAPPAAMARFFFSGGDSLMRSYPNGSIPQQARFKALGWSEEKRGGPIYLEVQLPDLQIKGRLYFYTPKPPPFSHKLKLKSLADCEQWARFEVFEIIEAPDEQLVEVGTTPDSEPPSLSQPAALGATAPPAPPQVFDPTVTLHAVAVQPAHIAPGGEVMLVLTYEIGGVPPGSLFQVTERRQLTRDGREIAAFNQQVSRSAGSFTSKLPVRLPPDVATGFYAVEASVELAGVNSTGTAFFQVTGQSR